MSLTLELLENLYVEHILIKVENSDLKEAELISQKYVNQTGKNYAYINSIVQSCFIKWMEDNLDLEQEKIFTNIPEIWNFVNGSSVTFKNKKLILIPSEVISLDEFVIPQEWVDIPTWAGDYYLPVQIDLDENYVHIWGYVSRKKLLQKGEYNHTYCNYYVDADYLINNVDLLWIACKMCEEKGNFKPLVNLRESEAQILIKEYREEMKNSPYSPRLKGDFQRWMTLLNNPQWLQQLTEENNIIIDLGKWLNEQFDQAIELGWLGINAICPQNLATSTRSRNINAQNCREKLINLQIELRQERVVMLLAISPEKNNKFKILVRIDPMNNQYLPPNLNLILRSDSGEKIQSVVARKHDNYIQLRSFSCPSQEKFSIELELNGIMVKENFVI